MPKSRLLKKYQSKRAAVLLPLCVDVEAADFVFSCLRAPPTADIGVGRASVQDRPAVLLCVRPRSLSP